MRRCALRVRQSGVRPVVVTYRILVAAVVFFIKVRPSRPKTIEALAE